MGEKLILPKKRVSLKVAYVSFFYNRCDGDYDERGGEREE